jgi:hypothetical protein
MVLFFCQIGASTINGPIGGNQSVHHIVDRFQRIDIVADIPIVKGQGIVPGPGLGFSSARHAEFIAVACDEVDLDLDFILRRPAVDLVLHYFVSPGNPVIPEADTQFAGGASGADMN